MLSVDQLSPAQQFPQFMWRPATIDDASTMHTLLLRRDAVDGLQVAITLHGIQNEFEDPWVKNPETHTLLALTPQGEAAAFVMIFADPQPEDKRAAFLWCEVHPDYLLPGLRDTLLEWAEQRGEEILDATPGDLPRVFEASAYEPLTDRIETLTRHGFERVRYFYHMRRDLSLPIPEPELADHLRLIPYPTELRIPVWEAFNDSFADHWNYSFFPLEDWDILILGKDGFRPDLSYVVLDGDQIAGFSMNTLSPEHNEQIDIKEAWIRELGTRRPWRKQGIATALLLMSMQAFKREGMDFATLGVDTDNPTGALHIYERLGFTPVRKIIAFHKWLDPREPDA